MSGIVTLMAFACLFSSLCFHKIPQNLNRKLKMGMMLGNVERDCTFQGGEGDDEMKIMMTFMMIIRMLYERCL